MPIAKITGEGLAAIACSVGILWGCILVEQVEHRAAVTERVKVVQELQHLQQRQRPEPVSTPAPFGPHHRHIMTAG